MQTAKGRNRLQVHDAQARFFPTTSWHFLPSAPGLTCNPMRKWFSVHPAAPQWVPSHHQSPPVPFPVPPQAPEQASPQGADPRTGTSSPLAAPAQVPAFFVDHSSEPTGELACSNQIVVMEIAFLSSERTLTLRPPVFSCFLAPAFAIVSPLQPPLSTSPSTQPLLLTFPAFPALCPKSSCSALCTPQEPLPSFRAGGRGTRPLWPMRWEPSPGAVPWSCRNPWWGDTQQPGVDSQTWCRGPNSGPSH